MQGLLGAYACMCVRLELPCVSFFELTEYSNIPGPGPTPTPLELHRGVGFGSNGTLWRINTVECIYRYASFNAEVRASTRWGDFFNCLLAGLFVAVYIGGA